MKNRIKPAIFGGCIMAIILAGCAVYNPAAVPAAQQEKTLAYEWCSRNRAATNVMLFDCYLEAEGAFAKAVSLQRMDLFRAYSSRVRAIAVTADSRSISQADRDRLFADAVNDYRAAIAQAVVDTAAAQNDLANAAGAFAVGAAAGYAARGRTQEPGHRAEPPRTAANASPAPAGTLPQMAPNGTFVNGTPTLCMDGTYVAGSCHMTPNGKYIGD